MFKTAEQIMLEDCLVKLGVVNFMKRFAPQAAHSPMWHDAAELGGLGMLAAPTAYEMASGKKANTKFKNVSELAGLGVLAVPSAHNIAKARKWIK